MPKLKRSIGLFEATMYGIGVIIGAGIYALLGEGAALAGNALWFSFLIGAVLAAFTGLSYCELSSMFPKEAAEYVYTRKAFGRKLGFMIGWVLIISSMVAAATVSIGFANYFSYIFHVPKFIVAVMLLFLLSLLNMWGISESSKFNIIATFAEMLGLILVIIAGIIFFNPNFEFFEAPSLNGIFSAAALMFFAYIGFQNIANISEEVKHAKSVVPKALLLSLVITTILYILVSLSAAMILGNELAKSGAPLALVLNKAFGFNASIFIAIIALFSTANTVLITLIVESRMLYGMANQKSLPKILAKVHKRFRTPYIAVFVAFLISVIALFLGEMKTVAELTTFNVFITFAFVNAAVIVLRIKKPYTKRIFKIPINIKNIPITAVLGLLTSVAMMIQFSFQLMLIEFILIIIGICIALKYV